MNFFWAIHSASEILLGDAFLGPHVPPRGVARRLDSEAWRLLLFRGGWLGLAFGLSKRSKGGAFSTLAKSASKYLPGLSMTLGGFKHLLFTRCKVSFPW